MYTAEQAVTGTGLACANANKGYTMSDSHLLQVCVG